MSSEAPQGYSAYMQSRSAEPRSSFGEEVEPITVHRSSSVDMADRASGRHSGSCSFEEHRPPMRRGSQLGLTKMVEEPDLAVNGPNAGCLADEALSVWMESACLECAVASNTAGERVWEEVCGVGFSLQIAHERPIRLGTELLITAELVTGLSRQVTFNVEARDLSSPELVYARGTHLRSYIPWEAMSGKVAAKLDKRQLKVGLMGHSDSLVQQRHLGGHNNVADPDGPVANCAGTASIVGFMEGAVASAVEGFLPEDQVLKTRSHRVDHLSPTPVGFVITATAELSSIEGGVLTFTLSAHDPFDKVATGVLVAELCDK